MAESARYRALEQAGLLYPGAEAVGAEPFRAHPEFFASFDKVQVKYEMLRAHVLDGRTATAAAHAHGFARRRSISVAAAFERSGMVGLVDERPGRRASRRSSRRRWSRSWRRAPARAPGRVWRGARGGAGGRVGGAPAPRTVEKAACMVSVCV